MPFSRWTPFEPLLREAVVACGGRDASPKDVLVYMQARWPADAFELTYSRLNPKVWAMKRELADMADAGGVTTAALAALAAGPEAEAAEASATTDTASVAASAGQVEALDVADAAAPAAAAPAAAPPAAAAAEGKPAAVSTLASGLTPALAAIAAGLFHVAPAEGFDQILVSLLSWGALAETPKALLALAA